MSSGVFIYVFIYLRKANVTNDVKIVLGNMGVSTGCVTLAAVSTFPAIARRDNVPLDEIATTTLIRS